MEGTSSDCNHMCSLKLIIFSYHRFGKEEHPYPFSRTYKQFEQDLDTMVFDMITIDDGHKSMIKACHMMQERNLRAKLFICTSLVGTENYCSWDELALLAEFHDIENHSHQHKYLTDLTDEQIHWNIRMAGRAIEKNLAIKCRYFVPPFNTADKRVRGIVRDFNLQLVSNRITIKNDTE